jgi:NADH-quinone oxidoreductase subunit N
VLDTLLNSLAFYIPEIITIALMCFLLIAESMHKEQGSDRIKVFKLAFVGLSLALVFLVINYFKVSTTIFYKAVVIDSFSTVLKMSMVIATAGAIWLSYSSKDIYADLKSEFAILAVGVLIGGMLLASANNLLTLYLGIETLSILSYVMSSLKRDESTSTEAGMKYALYGGLTAGIMLYGMSHMYGIFGSIHFAEMAQRIPALSGGDLGILLVSFLLFFVGLGYKISCFPFHMWSPDVYEGSPIPVTAFFSLVPKIAGMAVLVRVSQVFFSSPGTLNSAWIAMLQLVAVLTMSIGNITAIGQDSLKRLLAYSSIGHVGMMIMGVTVLNEIGTQAIVFYAITYVFMTLTAFYIISHLSDLYGTDSQFILKGLIHRNPIIGMIMVIVLFSLAGLPPFSGFVAKFNILSAVIEKKYYSMVFIAAINSVISLYYYIKVAKEIVFGKLESAEEVPGFTFGTKSLITIMAVPVVVLGIFWESVMNLSGSAKIFIP